MDSFLILVGTEKLHEELRKGGFHVEAEELRREVEEGAQTARDVMANDPDLRKYLGDHPEEMEQLRPLLNKREVQ